MKIFNVLFFLFFCIQAIWGQIYSTRLEYKTIIQPRNIYLNGGARASIGGKSRTVIPIKLPEGTKSWYYSFSTSPGESGTKNLNLFIQLSGLLVKDPTGLAKTFLSNIEVPGGSNSIDVYTFDQKNSDAFTEKVDSYGGSFNHYREGVVTNTRQAVVELLQVKDCYIGLKNPSTFDGVNITIEVVALVETQVYEDVWSLENQNRLYTGCLNSFSSRSSETEQICKCYRDNVMDEYVPSVYTVLSDNSLKEVQINGIEKCSKGTNNMTAIEKEEKIKYLLELYTGQSVTKDYASQEITLLELIQLGYSDYQIYNSLGFCQLCLGKNEDAKKSLQIGLGKKSTDLFLLGNLGSYFLLTKDYKAALKIYSEYKNEKIPGYGKFKKAVSDDLAEFERLGFRNEYFDLVRKELRIK